MVGIAQSAPASADPFSPSTRRDPFHLVYIAELEGAKLVTAKTTELGPDAVGLLSEEDRRWAKTIKARFEVPPPRDPGRVGPQLLRLLDTGDWDRRVRVVVTMQDNLKIPSFPQPADDESRDSEANQAALEVAKRLAEDLAKERAESYAHLERRIAELDGEIDKTFWLVHGLAASIPLGAVEHMTTWDDLQYVQLADPVTRPPVDGDPDNDTLDGRQRISSDPYFNLGQTQGWIGLLDSGVRADHQLFSAPDRIALHLDLTGDGDPGDNCDWWSGHGHGTGTASVLTANRNLGFNWRGVSGVRVDSFDVYGDDCGLNTDAVIEGFELGVLWLDRVLVAEIQANEAETGGIATAANNAFDAGVIVIAANGNFGPSAGTVRSPGNAHRALGIGADEVKDSVLEWYSGRGPTNDNRIKPDLVAPTNTEVASTAGVNATWEFGGTSGATPYAAGAASLVRNWMRPFGSFDPGHVYARMILYGQTAFPFDNDTGAGDLVMGTGGSVHYGKLSVTDGAAIDVPISVGGHRDTIQAALWWPESPGVHSDVDLYLYGPDGDLRDWSVSAPSVFERAVVNNEAESGVWTLRVTGYDVVGSQTVYWSARTR